MANTAGGWKNMSILNWLVVLTILEKYESQWEGLSHILWNIKDVPNHQGVKLLKHRKGGFKQTNMVG